MKHCIIFLAAVLLTSPAWSVDWTQWMGPNCDVLSKEQRSQAERMIETEIQRRTAEANSLNRKQWSEITNRQQWENFRDKRIAALRESLGQFPKPPNRLNTRTTQIIEGDGFRIENILYESRPQQWVPGNLYVPAKSAKSKPGILIAHSHHGGKTDRELQDMGMTWARAGCFVLVIDQIGYGERRTHPFKSDSDYSKPYKASRQDYYFRQDTGIQLQLLGDSLMGWMVWDLMRGVDLLLAQDGIDPQRIILFGSVAGGGDPAGVTAALDQRIACCVPFNFGGPQPETQYPLPKDAETSFNYLGGAYWESTRGLRLGGRDGFLHWVIVGSTAPRRLIHAHEFAWDQEHDPVWKRYQKIWGDFYGAPDNLGFAHGKGSLKERPPAASHCNNIGAYHRRMIHPLLERWFGIKVHDEDEYSMPRKPSELLCITAAAAQELKPKSLNELMTIEGQDRINAVRKQLRNMARVENRAYLRKAWEKLLGQITPASAPVVLYKNSGELSGSGVKFERIVLEVEPGIIVPTIILLPAEIREPAPVVICIAQAGKAGFIKQRSDELQRLVQEGVIVVMADVRGTGESFAGDTDLAARLQLFGETLLGQRLRDLRSILAMIRVRKDVDPRRIALWGDSFAPTNTRETNFKVPRNVAEWPRGPEPLGGLLALLGALFEDEIHAVYVAGGLTSYHNILSHFAVLIPHSTAIPGALTAGELSDLVGSIFPRPLRMEAMVDHLNRTATSSELQRIYSGAIQAYASKPEAISYSETRASPATWLLKQLKH